MRLTLVISSLARGGAERVMSQLANSWSSRGNEVTVLTFDHGEEPAYTIDPSVGLQPLGLLQSSSNSFQGLLRNFHRIKVLRRAIRNSRPDVVISFMDKVNILTLLATRGLGKPVVISERTNPYGYRIGRVWSILRRATYRLADELICQTGAVLLAFREITEVKARVIPNPVEVPEQLVTGKTRQEMPSEKWILVAMGRLGPEKGFDLLLNAFARISNRHPDWSLKILGEGALRNQLEVQASDLKMENQVHFLGEVANPFPILSSADLFVLPSRVEGFPMALCEAMACGLPVVGFDCPSGPAEIIRHEVDGILVPPEDVAALASALDRLMCDAKERERLAARATEVVTRFHKDRILSLWEDLFDELLAGDSDVGARKSTTRRSEP